MRDAKGVAHYAWGLWRCKWGRVLLASEKPHMFARMGETDECRWCELSEEHPIHREKWRMETALSPTPSPLADDLSDAREVISPSPDMTPAGLGHEHSGFLG